MIIALIGSPLSGKTTVLKKLQEKGMRVFSADSHVTKIYKSGEVGYELIKETLGPDFVNEESVDRRALAEWASIEGNLERLNELIHPLIFEYLEDKDDFISELPIISTSPVKFKYDKLVLVRADEEVIANRFSNTKLRNPEFIKKIIEDWNKDLEYDYVIDTTNDVQELDIDNIIKMLNGN